MGSYLQLKQVLKYAALCLFGVQLAAIHWSVAHAFNPHGYDITMFAYGDYPPLIILSRKF